MIDKGHDEQEEYQRPPKALPASARQRDYLWNLAKGEGMDAEDLASIHYGKDMADLTEDEACALITSILKE